MDMLSTFHRLLQHDDWANRKVFAVLTGAPEVPRARAVFAHIIGAEWLWLARLKGEPSRYPVWPDFTLPDAEAQLLPLRRAWSNYLAELTPQALRMQVPYKNSKGERWENAVGDIVLHVAMHSSYHRGQIAILVRDAGVEPAYTDYIEAVRRELV